MFCKMKTELESKFYTQKIRIKIWTFILILWLMTYKRVVLTLDVSFYIWKFNGNYWQSPYNLHLLNFISEAHFFLSDVLCRIYDGYVQTYTVPLYIPVALQCFILLGQSVKFWYCLHIWPHNHLLCLFTVVTSAWVCYQHRLHAYNCKLSVPCK